MTAPLFVAPTVHPAEFPTGEWPGPLTPLAPAARVQAEALAALARVQADAEQLAADPHLTPEGQRARLTERVAPLLDGLASRAPTLDTLAAALTAEASALVPTAPPADVAQAEADARAIGRLPVAERTALLESAMTGQDRRALRAFALSPHWLTGVSAPQQARLAALLQQDAEGAVDADARAAVAARAELLGRARATVLAVRTALEDAADRQVLRAKGVAVQLRRSDMPEADRVAFIGKNGLDAFKAHPA